jgi:hypothetical protein
MSLQDPTQRMQEILERYTGQTRLNGSIDKDQALAELSKVMDEARIDEIERMRIKGSSYGYGEMFVIEGRYLDDRLIEIAALKARQPSGEGEV